MVSIAKRFLLALFLTAFSIFLGSAGAQAQTHESLTLIRDAEIEHYLRELATPIFRAADIDPSAVSLVIVKSNVMNAFVAGGMNMFFYTGLLQAAETPEQLLGIIAHETGHIAGGHIVRGKEAMKNASAEAILGMLAGLAAGLATGNSQITMATIGGAQTFAERSFFSFSRAQESSADFAALSFLDKAGITAKGLDEFMQKLMAQESLPTDRQSEYVRTHPLTHDRVESIQNSLQKSPYTSQQLSPKYKTMHERMKAKLFGYLQPQAALLRTTDKDPRLTVRYSRAVAFAQTSQLQRALALMDSLIQEEPNNPYFYELKAQTLFESGRVEEAATLYKKTVDLVPDSALLRIAYAHALLENKNNANIDLAIQQLLEANRLEERDQQTWHFLAVAWGRKGEITKDPVQEAMAVYARAEEALARGADKEAGQLAERALKVLPKGSPYWVKAQDIKISIETDAEH